MKRIVMVCYTILCGSKIFAQIDSLERDIQTDSFYLLSPVEVRAVRAGENTPFTKTNISQTEIRKYNLGQDIPFLLNQTPSVVVQSDAGNGVGYTGMRIRGTDPARINITLNGIPFNDAESQGSFFVDLPDFSSSVGSIQIQRGVGSSSNGSGAFGASINFSTNEIHKDAFAEFDNSYGSFNTRKHSLRLGTGLLNEHFTGELRLSSINSDGYIDRASSDLRSFHFTTAYVNQKSSLRLNIFSGKEKTYQAWNGVSQADLDAGRRKINSAGTEKPGEPYKNETDNYKQDHYQLFFNQELDSRIKLSTAFFLTRGRGYYEQYKAEQDYVEYGINKPGTTDLVRQLWLDNDFYGNIFSFHYRNKKTSATLGGSFTRYNGRHFGKLIWAMNGLPVPDNKWYDLNAQKSEASIYFKQQTEISDHWYLYYDLQFRAVNYDLNGFRDHPGLILSNNFHFLNPKIGASYIRNGWKTYLSFGIANKEPNRDDFETETTERPRPERLYDIELGLERNAKKYNWSAVVYHMKYRDQLILTGRINDVGAYTRMNIPNSYRAGLELQGAIQVNKWFSIDGNLTFSRNKVINFQEFIDDYDNGGQKINHYSKTDIALSPSIIAASVLNFKPTSFLEISLPSKFVDRQYLDNTENLSRSLDPFFVQDLRIIYKPLCKLLKEITIIAQLNNLFNNKYEPSGYTYNYIYGGELFVNNYYFPMAGINGMLGVNLKL